MRDLQQLYGTRSDSERQPETMGDSEKHATTPWDHRDRQQPLETLSYMQLLNGIKETARDSQQPWETVRDM